MIPQRASLTIPTPPAGAGPRRAPGPAPALLFALIAVLVGCAGDPRYELSPVGADPADTRAVPPPRVRELTPDKDARTLVRSVPADASRQMLVELLQVSQAITGDGFVPGNDARLLIDGPATFAAMFEDIDAAREHIHIETFILHDDEVGRRLLSRLIRARERGVRVRVLVDAFGSFELPDARLDALREQGIEIRKFHPLDPTEDPRIWRSNNRNHRKIMVVDGRVAYTGGINFSDTYSESSLSVPHAARRSDAAWRDTHVRLEGPVVAKIQHSFVALWNKDLDAREHLAGEHLFPPLREAGDMIAGIVASSGGDDREFDIYSVLTAAIEHAQERVWITQAYFAPDEAFIGTLEDAARRGVDVRMILPGVSDAPLVIHASRSSYGGLLDAGVKIYERTSSTLHAKTVVIDGVWSTIGSANFDYRSFVHNWELNAVIIDRDFGQAMDAIFKADLQKTEPITAVQWAKRPLTQRVKETLGRWLRPWL